MFLSVHVIAERNLHVIVEREFTESKKHGILMFKTWLWNGKEVYTNYVQAVNVNTIMSFYFEILRDIKKMK